MSATTAWPVLLLAATAVHAGFQTTVTVLVYPALSRVGPADWEREHGLHSRRITPLVGAVYGFLAVACVGAMMTLPWSAGLWLALVGSAATALVTAVGAAPTHGRLTNSPEPWLVHRLLIVDRWRSGCALAALAGALVLALG